jgi:hypothetical protein
MANHQATSNDNAALRWSPAKRAIVSGLLIFHLAAVFIPPFAFQTGTSSPLAQPLMRLVGPYADAAYLNHGYAFFAPDPGSSYLLRASMEFDDGRETIHRTMPDLNVDWPRLRYHRHFMLSEHLNASFLPPEPPPEMAENPAELAFWQRQHLLYEARRQAIISHLQRKHGAARVNLRRVEHQLLDPYVFNQSNRPIDSPETYIELSETPMREAAP